MPKLECFHLTVGQILIKVDQFNIDSGTDEANTATETVCGTSKFVGSIGGVLKTNIYVSFANIIYVFGAGLARTTFLSAYSNQFLIRTV